MNGEQDILKEIWLQGEQHLGQQKIPQESLDRAKTSRSKDLIARFRRTLRLEMAFNALFFLVFPFFLEGTHIERLPFNKAMIALGFYLVVFFLYFWLSYRTLQRIRRCRKEDDSVQYLHQVLVVLESFVFQYRLKCLIMVPAGSILGFLLGFQQTAWWLDTSVLLATLLSIVLITLVGMALCELYIYWVYRRQIRRIRTMLTFEG